MILVWVSLFIFSTAPASAGIVSLCERAYALFGVSKSGTAVREASPPAAEPKPLTPEEEVLVLDAAVDINKRLRKIDPNLAAALGWLQQLKPTLISGKQTPSWDDFRILDAILSSIRAGKPLAAENGKAAELNALLPDLVRFAKQDPALQKLSAAGNLKRAKAEGYVPTEYELKRLYQYKLWEINRELPPSLKIRGARLPFDQRRNTLAGEARALIKAQEEKYQSLYPTTGFPNREALIEAIKKQGPEAEAILDMIEKEKVDFVMRRPETGRWWIPKVGFQNQRVSGSSNGTLSTDYRDTAEAFLTFGKRSEFEKLDNDLKPKYGYLRPEPGQYLVEEREATSRYGEDFYILKKNNLRDRATWTPGDSLGIGWRRSEIEVPKIWHEAFTPWSNRELIVPVVLPKLTAENKTFGLGLPNFLDPSPLKDFPKTLPNTRYLEMQYWGPVTLDDVEAFEFSKTPPFGEFLDELLKRKIKIRNVTSGSPVDWHPPAPAEK